MQRTLILLGCIVALTGCASSTAVRSSKYLPVKNVVLYRSGVGYFERSGSFDGKSLKFSVRKDEVGDFLASLTAVDKAESGVRSIAFEVPEKAPVAPPPEGEKRSDPPDEKAERVDVQLMLGAGGKHDIDVSYVVGSPIWRPSYRVVLDKGQKALLQAWAVVQNLSGEDWNDVKLSLTTGAPISFRSDLGTPITPVRPLVSDTGEVVSAVPMGEVALAQGASAMAPPAPPAEAEVSASYDRDDAAEPEMMRAKNRRWRVRWPAPRSAGLRPHRAPSRLNTPW